MKGYDICYNCGVVQEYGTMRDVNENDFDIFCNDCHPSYDLNGIEETMRTNSIPMTNDFEEMLTYMYEVDRDNCLFTHKDWIRELALAMTDPRYKEKFLVEHYEYVKAMRE